MIYTVFSTSHSPYQQWQSELLEYSWKEVGQDGELIRLVAMDDHQEAPTHQYARTVVTQPWHLHPVTGDRYVIYNKPASLLEWLYNENPHGTVLLIDPDCVFRAPINREVDEGHPAAQAWIDLHVNDHDQAFGLGEGFDELARHCANPQPRVQGVMIPTLIHTRDLRRIIVRWLELTGMVRQYAKNHRGEPRWESDMFGYIIAAAEYGLRHELGTFGICPNWDPRQVPNAPIVHYCQAIESHNGERIWAKGTYQPWEKVPSPLLAKRRDGQDLLTILTRFINSRKGLAAEAAVRPRRRDGVLEGRVRDDLLLFAPGSEHSFSLNASGQAIWELCDGQRTVAEISHALQQRYAGAASELLDDVSMAIDRLRDVGMLEIESA